MKNEIIVNKQTGEIVENTPKIFSETIVHDTEEFTIYLQEDGKYRKEMKYREYHSHQAETEEEKKELFKVLHGQDNEKVKTMATLQGKEFEIEQAFITPYEKFDENTGRNENGVTCTLKTTDGFYIATSSKSVYYTLINMFNVFGYPHEENYQPIKVRVKGTRRENGTQIDLVLV